MDEWITVKEACLIFDCPFQAIAGFIRVGLLEKVPSEKTTRWAEHVNQRFFLRAEQLQDLMSRRRPATLPGEWLCYQDAARHIGMSEAFVKKAVTTGALRKAAWLEIAAEQRVGKRRTYVNRSELDRLTAARYCNQALIVPEHHDPLDLAYAAGFFDGEGCIGLHCDRRKGCCYYSLRATLANTDRAAIQWLMGAFGGNLHTRKQTNSAWKIGYCWSTSSATAYQFLSLVQPYLRIKRPQAELAIQFYERLIHYSGRGGKRVTAPELAWRVEQVRLLHDMNRKGQANSE